MDNHANTLYGYKFITITILIYYTSLDRNFVYQVCNILISLEIPAIMI